MTNYDIGWATCELCGVKRPERDLVTATIRTTIGDQSSERSEVRCARCPTSKYESSPTPRVFRAYLWFGGETWE